METTINPDILADTPPGYIPKGMHGGGIPGFTGHRRKKIYTDTINSYTCNTDPLKATKTRNMVAFKGSVFSAVKGLGRSFKKSVFIKDFRASLEPTTARKAGELLTEVRRVLPYRRNPGIDSLEHFFATGGKRVLKTPPKEPLWSINVKMSETPGAGLKRALSSPFKWVKDTFDILTKDEAVKNRIKDKRAIEKNSKKLLGYQNAATKHGERFDNAFSGENLDTIKTHLVKGEQEELKKFLKSRKTGIDTRQLFDGRKNWFNSLKRNLIDAKGEKATKRLEAMRRGYASNVILDIENTRIGSPIAKYSSDHARLTNRLGSGLTTAAFVAQDFHNLYMMANDDPEGAKKERNKRFTQQASYIGLTAYFDYLTGATFRTMSNKYLGFAVGLGVFTSLAANVASRVINGMPLLPTKPKGMEKKPYIIKASPLRRTGFESSGQAQDKQNADNAGFKAYNRLKNKSVTHNAPAFKGFGRMATETFSNFEETYEVLRRIQPKRAHKFLSTPLKFLRKIDKNFPKKGEHITIDHIRKTAAKKLGGNVIIGDGRAVSMLKSAAEGVILPFKLLYKAGVGIANLALKAMGKDLIKTNDKRRFSHAKSVKNLINQTKEAKKAAGHEGKISKASDDVIENIRLCFGDKTNGFHDPNRMEFGSDQMSSFMKLTGFIAVPFLAIDAYNVTARETQNENISVAKAKQRAVQDSTRQAVSFWAVKAFNDVFKDLINHSIGGSAISTIANCTGYEAATRLVVGQPILSRTHKEMKEIEKRRLKNPNWLSKVLVKQRVRTKDDEVILGSKRLLRENENPYPLQTAPSFSSDYAGFEKNLGLVKGFFKS